MRSVARYNPSSVITESDEEIWEESHSEDEDGLGVGTCGEQPSLPTFETSTDSERAQVLCRWLVGFLLLQGRYYIPNSALTVLVKFLYALFSILGPFSHLCFQDSPQVILPFIGNGWLRWEMHCVHKVLQTLCT